MPHNTPEKRAAYLAKNRERVLKNMRDRARVRRALAYGAPSVDPPTGQTCEICTGPGGAKGIFMDHNHATSRFRGWLCERCNFALGLLDDSPEKLQAAIEYLRAKS